MKSNYKKALIALGLMAAVLLYYKYSTVTEGLSGQDDPFIKRTNKYIADIKTLIDDKKRKIKTLINNLEQKSKSKSKSKLNSQDIQKLNNLNTHITNIFTKYRANMMLHPNDLNFQILINEVSEIPPPSKSAETAESLKQINDSVSYIIEKLAFINNIKRFNLKITKTSEPTPIDLSTPLPI
jgi:hypothetical protein